MEQSSPKQSVRKKAKAGWGGHRHGTPGYKPNINARFASWEQIQQVKKAAKAAGETGSQYIVRATLVRMAKDEIRGEGNSVTFNYTSPEPVSSRSGGLGGLES